MSGGPKLQFSTLLHCGGEWTIGTLYIHVWKRSERVNCCLIHSSSIVTISGFSEHNTHSTKKKIPNLDWLVIELWIFMHLSMYFTYAIIWNRIIGWGKSCENYKAWYQSLRVKSNRNIKQNKKKKKDSNLEKLLKESFK